MGKKLLIILAFILFVWVFLFYFFNNKYNHNYYEVMVNGQKMDYYIQEYYHRTWIPYLLFAKNWKHEWGIEQNENRLNYIDMSDIFDLVVLEYSCYNSEADKRIDCDTNQEEKRKVDSNITRLIIERKKQVIYDGKYDNNITKYISEPGRYYFKVYLSKKDEKEATIDTHLIFNIKFEGEPNE